MNKFQERFKNEMTIRGLNPSQFAKLLDISQQNVHRYIAEGRTPNGDALTLICEKLKISADWLLGMTDEKETQIPENNKSIVGISNDSVERLIRQNEALSNAAESLGRSHEKLTETLDKIASINGHLERRNEELSKELHDVKGCTPADVTTGGGRATKHAATG